MPPAEDGGMEQGRILFPDITHSVAPAPRVVRFEPRQLRRAGPSRLSGEGLADRLRHDVERQIAHRRRMLAHLSAQTRRA